MGALADLRKRWFVLILSVAAAVFFAGALVHSAVTYVNLMEARQGIELRNAIEYAEELDNGTLMVGISIELHNPSDLDLNVYLVSWSVRLLNDTDGVTSYIPVASDFGSSATNLLIVEDGTTRTLEYMAFVTDSDKLAAIRGFINHSMDLGDEYTMETLPYLHDFRITGWIDDFDHDYQYQKELYLNDMVKIERTYHAGVYL